MFKRSPVRQVHQISPPHHFAALPGAKNSLRAPKTPPAAQARATYAGAEKQETGRDSLKLLKRFEMLDLVVGVQKSERIGTERR